MSIFYLCLKVFFARILDVSIGTVRTIVTIKGKSFISAILAFIEVFIWFIVAREALRSAESSWLIAISYAGGYAVGTYLGIYLSSFIKGIVGVQVITDKISQNMIDTIRNNGFAVSVINLHSYSKEETKKEMLFIQVTSNKQKKLIELIKKLDEKAFIVVNETKYVQNGFIK